MGVPVFVGQRFLCHYVGYVQGPTGPMFTQNSQLYASVQLHPSQHKGHESELSGTVAFTEPFRSRLAWGGRVPEPLPYIGSTRKHVEGCMVAHICLEPAD